MEQTTNQPIHSCTREQFARDCKRFTLDELTAIQFKQTAINAGYDPEPIEEQIECLRQLVVHVLDPLRELWKGPIWVNSGYRCPFVNGAVGGAAGSQHTKGQAADISIRLEGMIPNRILNRMLLGRILSSTLSFDQLIAEGCDVYGYPSWLHISYKSMSENRNQFILSKS